MSASVHAGIHIPPGQTHPNAQTPQWAYTSPPPSRQLLQPAVCILLECILVAISKYSVLCIYGLLDNVLTAYGNIVHARLKTMFYRN